ncbi:MAG: transposase [Formivibrio sp.]|nr:transposase [Formivibrio sp.]
MARYRRANAAGACYFFTVVTERRQRILIEEDADFATRWRLIKSHVTRLCGPRYFRPEWLTARRASKCCGTIWQHRYWEHQIRDEADLRHHIDYLHFNPVKHGYVRQAADWPYSSIHRFIERGWIAEDWAGLE